jgi:hypothetical protein
MNAFREKRKDVAAETNIVARVEEKIRVKKMMLNHVDILPPKLLFYEHVNPSKSLASTITPTQNTMALLRGSQHGRFRPNDELRQLHQR